MDNNEMKKTKRTIAIVIFVFISMLIAGFCLLLVFAGEILNGLCGAADC